MIHGNEKDLVVLGMYGIILPTSVGMIPNKPLYIYIRIPTNQPVYIYNGKAASWLSFPGAALFVVGGAPRLLGRNRRPAAQRSVGLSR